MADATHKKWVLTAASSEYFVGSFDGEKFTPETPKLPGQRGRGFYAAQTYSDVPDAPPHQIGWGQAPVARDAVQPTPHFSLRAAIAPDPGLARACIAGCQSRNSKRFRVKSWSVGSVDLAEGAANRFGGGARRIARRFTVTFNPPPVAKSSSACRGAEIRYDTAQQEISVNGLRAPAPLENGHQRLAIYTDRTYLTVFASGGHAYVPLPFIAKPDDLGVEMQVKGGTAAVQELAAHQLKSIWEAQP